MRGLRVIKWAIAAVKGLHPFSRIRGTEVLKTESFLNDERQCRAARIPVSVKQTVQKGSFFAILTMLPQSRFYSW